MFPCTVFAFEEILYRPQSHLRQVYLETLDSNFTRACCAWGSDREHCGFILPSSECSDSGTWRYMFRPHSNSWTPGPGWVQSNGDGPPFPTVNSEWGEREWQKGDQNGITATWELVLIFWNYRFFHLIAIAEKVEIWANTLSQSRAATPSKPSKEGYLYSDLIGPRNECRWLKLINKDRRINWLALWW